MALVFVSPAWYGYTMTNFDNNMTAYAAGFQAGYDGVSVEADLANLPQSGPLLNAYYNGYEDGTDAYLADSDHADFTDESPFCQDGIDDDGLSDVEADAMTLAGAGYGTDEDYGYYNDDFGSYFGGEDYYG